MYDITIVGAGPIGLYAAYYAGLRAMRTRIVDLLPEPGGRLTSIYSDKEIQDVAGHSRIVTAELVGKLVDQAKASEPTFSMGERVVSLKIEGELAIRLSTSAGTAFWSRTVVLCAGGGAFVPRKLDIPHIGALEERGILSFLPRLDSLRGKRILIVGGGNAAVEWALALEGVASSVVLCHRMYTWQAHEAAVNRLLASSVTVKYPYFGLMEIVGEERVEGAVIWNDRSGLCETIHVDAILLSIGTLTNMTPFREWGLEVSGNGIAVATDMSTNLPGVYAAGDIVTYPGKIPLITAGVSEAATAVNSAKESLFNAGI